MTEDPAKLTKYRAIWIEFIDMDPSDWPKLAWGCDIWVQGFPVLKIFLLANLLMWAAMWWTR